MENAISRTNRRSGWSDRETGLLWETADEAQQQGLPLKAVFEQIAEKTGRRPNSIRNYYYAQIRQRKGGQAASARFIPFTEPEVEWLVTQVLKDRAKGISVRACLQRLSGGDHSLMLRYQNKYRAVLKSRPEYVRVIVERLNAEGVACIAPEVSHRARTSAETACQRLSDSAYRSGDAELVRLCETLCALIDASRRDERFASPALVAAAKAFVAPVKEFVSLPAAHRAEQADAFASDMASLIGEMEAHLPAETVCALPSLG